MAVVCARSSSIELGAGPNASHRPPSQHAGKHKANELASSGDSTELPICAQYLALVPHLCPRSNQSLAN